MFTLPGLRLPPVEEGQRRVGVQLERLVEILDGSPKILLSGPRPTSIMEGVRLLRVES